MGKFNLTEKFAYNSITKIFFLVGESSLMNNYVTRYLEIIIWSIHRLPVISAPSTESVGCQQRMVLYKISLTSEYGFSFKGAWASKLSRESFLPPSLPRDIVNKPNAPDLPPSNHHASLSLSFSLSSSASSPPPFLIFFLSSRHLHIWCALQTANFRRTSERAHVLLIRSKKIKNRRDSGGNIINCSFSHSTHLITLLFIVDKTTDQSYI